MGQRLYRCHAHEGRKPEVDCANLIAVALEIGPEESGDVAIEGFYIRKPSGARNLLGEDAMQLGVDAMRLDRDRNEPAHRCLNWLRGDLRQCAMDDLHDVLV